LEILSTFIAVKPCNRNNDMKNIPFLLFASILFVSCGPTTVVVQSDSYHAPAPAPVEDVSYQSFYDQLSPYGNWINYPGYGYVWMPDAGADFVPYSTNGNWIYSDAGWTWSSNYSWGWAPFHYGRWFYENGYGWMWVPGNEWAPAWVSWRGSGDYYGWAPLSPGISVDIALNNYNPPANYWNFVPRQYMGNPGWHNYNVSGNRNVTIINNTTIINNYSGTNRARYAYAPGPDPNEVRRVSGNNFATVQIQETNTPGERVSGSQYMIYHPRVNSNPAPAARADVSGRPAASAPAPARYQSFSNMHPSAQPSAANPQQPTVIGQRSSVNGQPSTIPPSNPRPTGQNNEPVNGQPTYFQRPTAQNPGPAAQPAKPLTPVQQPALLSTANRPPSTNLQPTTVNGHPSTNLQPTTVNGQGSTVNGHPQPTTVNGQRSVIGKPTVNNQPPTNPHPQKPKVKPAAKPVEKPKPTEADK
jgi:hypothetical protein